MDAVRPPARRDERVGRGELGGEDIRDGELRVGTATQYIHICTHYCQPEQEMFPTARTESRTYTVCGLPDGLRLVVQMEREWKAGRLICASIAFEGVAPSPRRPDLEELFRSAFEARA